MENDLETNERQSDSKGIRHLMKTFWKEHSKHGDLTDMLLDSNAEIISAIELDEILQLLPDHQGKTVLELGAGIGRFTTHLAKRAKSVVAVDFMETFIQKNEMTNGHLSNVQLICMNVLSLSFPDNRFDMIFSNWLLMYLSEEEIATLISSMLRWLKPGGTLFFRESCKCKSGDTKRNFNPTQYRGSWEYDALFNKTTVSKNGQIIGFRVIKSKPVQAYIKELPEQKFVLIYTSTASLGYVNVRRREKQVQFPLNYSRIFAYIQLLVKREAGIDITLKLIDVFHKLLRNGFKRKLSEDKIDELLEILRKKLKLTD